MHKIPFAILLLIFISQFKSLAELKDITNQADYIIICPKEFYSTLIPFKEWRESKDMSVEIVDIEDIYQEFPSNGLQTESIRSFLMYAFNKWQQPKVKYVLLAGAVNYIPSHKEYSYYQEFEDLISIDEWFVTFIDEMKFTNTVQIALGRFPARNVRELNNMIFKTMKFEDLDYYSNNKYALTVFTDKKDAIEFEKSAEMLIENLGKPNNVKRIYQTDTSRYWGNRDSLIYTMRAGSSFLFNFVHGQPDIWGFYNNFSSKDLDTLVISYNPFILTANSCSQSFDNIHTPGIIEKILTVDTNNAVATLASSGITFNSTSKEFISDVFRKIFEKDKLRFGDAILKTKQSNYGLVNLNTRFSLLGDPALLIRTDKIADVEPVLPSNGTLAIAPNPASDMTNIRFISENSCKAILEVIDVMGRIVFVKEYSVTSADNKFGLDVSALSSGMYLITVKINGYSIREKLLISK